MLPALAALAAFTIVYGSVRAVFQDDLKRQLAFSTVSQVSYIALGAGIAAAFCGALVGVAQSYPKTVLAYSSISQMGLITVPVGAALLAPALWPAALAAVLLYALHHALAKGALFLGVVAL